MNALLSQAVETILAKALGQDASKLAASEKRDLLARLLGRLAHEIRNPLSSMDVHVQLLEEDLAGISPAAREQLDSRLEIIRGELHRLESIVSQFLRLTGPSDLDLARVNVASLAEHVCGLLLPEAAARGITLTAEVSPDLPDITGDPVRLTQVLLNLAINAMQAVERQGRIVVSARRSEGEVLVLVTDSGPGIPLEQLDSIFDPYYTTKKEGHGLGLWIAQQIVTSHGGNLSAQNGAGGGAIFMMSLPTKREPALADETSRG